MKKSISKDILDEVEKYSGPRTCPECGYQFPFWGFVRRFLMSKGSSNWPCQSCRRLLKCDFVKIQTLWMVGLLVSGVIFAYVTSYFDSDLLNIVFLLSNFAFVLLTFFYAKLERFK